MFLVGMTPQIDRFGVMWWDKELWLRAFFVVFVDNGTPGCLLEGILDGFRCLGRRFIMGEWLRSRDRSSRGRSAPLLCLLARYQPIVGLVLPWCLDLKKGEK